MGSGFPRKLCPNVHDWGQVCMFQGKNGRDFRAFTMSIVGATLVVALTSPWSPCVLWSRMLCSRMLCSPPPRNLHNLSTLSIYLAPARTSSAMHSIWYV